MCERKVNERNRDLSPTRTVVVILKQCQVVIARTIPLIQDKIGDFATPELMAIVSITRLRVRSWLYLAPFLFYALRSSRQAKHSPGNLAVSLLRDIDLTFWSCTVWTAESTMKGFMLAGVHRNAMQKPLEWCDEAALVRWEQESDQQPTWDEAHRNLQAQGRRSKVSHPSRAHESFKIRPPRQ